MRLSLLSLSLSLSLSLLSLFLSLHCFVVDASIDAAVGRTLGHARIFKSAGQAKAAEALSRSAMPGNDLPLFRRPE